MAEVTAGDGPAPFDRRDAALAGLRKLVDSQAALIERQRLGLRNAAVGYFILLFGMVGGLFALERHDAGRAREAERVALRAQVKACERVNVLRQQANATAEISFATLWASAARERALSGGGDGVHGQSAEALEFLASKTLRTDLTDCRMAVYFVDDYRPPTPRAFDPRTDPLTQIVIGRFQGDRR